MGGDSVPADSETIASRFLFLTAIVAGIFLGTHFIKSEQEPEVLLPSQVEVLKADMEKEFNVKEDALKKQVTDVQIEAGKEREAKEDAITRLSAIISNRVRDNNPDIVDLSDPNRPEKIAGMYSELYSNQWTDAYEVLESTFKNNENKIFQFLVDILKICFETCQEEGEKELERLRSSVKHVEQELTTKHKTLQSDLMQRIKDERKLSATGQVPDYNKISKLKKYFKSSKANDKVNMQQPDMKAYIKECLRICRLMVIQDPPMTLLFKPDVAVINSFREYRNKGTRVDIVVWPALLLKEGGPMVSQGVVKFY
ncbi:uncharacterized protein LOC132753897 isoform X3 [Ruditapes philippinarum]|uniref:uncharacterized protein LOC132753897 isoform X3 n=1 Tax=Ruditapes philippinarum TaxID=129788 RepID=UPI00295BA6AF|nr:uncharacterized protein LOC132753897 isoform X3 [Ruditapes philippinarum]